MMNSNTSHKPPLTGSESTKHCHAHSQVLNADGKGATAKQSRGSPRGQLNVFSKKNGGVLHENAKSTSAIPVKLGQSGTSPREETKSFTKIAIGGKSMSRGANQGLNPRATLKS